MKPVSRRVVSRAGVGAVAVALLLASTLALLHVGAASAFASPLFQQQWQQGENVAPNFWGPLANAKDGMQEQYAEAPGGQRLVQYFDKARMELTNPAGPVTNGLLATELVRGQLQVGDTAFQPRTPPAIPIAGDPDNPGPTYLTLATSQGGQTVLAAAAAQIGTRISTALGPNGELAGGVLSAGPGTQIAAFDDATKHNVTQAFVEYRGRVGLLTIGYAISEPFAAQVKVAGTPRSVIIQVFERRVLTYTADNPAAFQVEFGNIGQHYYQWRYSTPVPPLPPPVITPTPTTPVTGTISAPVFTNLTNTPGTGVGVTVSYGTSFPACGTAEYRVQGTVPWVTGIGSITCTAALATTTFAIPVTNLVANTTYEIRPAVKDVAQNISYGPVGVLPTGGAVGAFTVSTPAIVSLNPTSVTISFTTNVPTCGVAQYRVTGRDTWSADTDIGSLTCRAGDTTQTHNKTLTGISPGASLDLRGAAKDVNGNIVYSNPVSITTPSA